MTKANDLASLLDANGDVVSSALDNVPASDLVNDTTPQLGGNLDLFGNNITGNGRIDITSATSPQLKLSYSADTWLKLSQSGGATMLESKSGAGDGEIYLMGGQSGKSRMIVRTDGDVEFFNTDGVTKKMEWNATSNTLDVTGTVTADYLDITAADNAITSKIANTTGANYLQITNGTANGYFGTTGANTVSVLSIGTHPITFGTDGGTERLRITGDGRVGIANDAPVALLDVASGTNTTLSVPSGVVAKFKGDITLNSLSTASSGDIESIYFQKSHTAGVNIGNYDLGIITAYTGNGYTGGLDFYTGKNIGGGNYAATFAMRIDEDQNLLVGRTSVGITGNGHSIRGGDSALFSRDGAGETMQVGRNAIDGDLIRFNSNGVWVGSIGVSGGNNIYISGEAASHSGLTFATNEILPTAQGNITDGAESLGSSSNRFNNLYLSGGVYLGGTGSANLLDSYEEGTWNGTLKGVGSDPTTPVTATGEYTKVGRKVYVEIRFSNVSNVGASGTVYVSGLPFTVNTPYAASGNCAAYLFDFPSGLTSISVQVSGTNLYPYISGDSTTWDGLKHAPGTARYLEISAQYTVA